METQTCGHCREAKEISEFAPSYRGRPGTWCRACNRKRYVPRRPPKRQDGQIRCGKCELYKPESEFYQSNDSWCKPCYRQWYRGRHEPQDGATDNPRPCVVCGAVFRPKQRKPAIYCSDLCAGRSVAKRDWYLRRKYGIPAAEYDRLLTEQGGGCAICGKPPEQQERYRRYLHVDHCHETGRVRGLLCDQHNLMLGRWLHDPVLLRRAADYLEGARHGPDAADRSIPR